jgi:hypothetical protein
MIQEQIIKADEWRIKHNEYVSRILNDGLSGHGFYEPSEEDAGSPELWKPAHWRWFNIHA